MSEQRKRTGLATLDIFVIIGAILLIFGMIGQNTAIYLMDQRDRAEILELSFVLRSVAISEAEQLLEAQNAAEEGLSCLYGGRELGRVGTVHKNDILSDRYDGGVHPGLCDLSGVLVAKGKSDNGGTVYLYGYGEVEQGDILFLELAEKTVGLELTVVNVKKNEKST